jgi:S1-C subfamily serine protease
VRRAGIALLFAACAARPPALHRNPVVKILYRGSRPLTPEQRRTKALPPWYRELHTATGSGFFANQRGDIVTSYHVVQRDGVNRSEVVVTVDEEWLYPARVMHLDKRADLAVIRIEADSETLLPVLGLGRGAVSGAVVRVQGYPGGGPFRETAGTLVGTGELLECALNARIGNSGGPLLSERGRVLGVVTGLKKRRFAGDRAQVTAEFCLVVPVKTLRARLEAWNVAHR